MGFLKNFLPILLLVISGCTKDIVIKDTSVDAESLPMYGKNPLRNFHYNIEKKYDLDLEWDSSTHGNFGNTSFVVYDTTLITTSLSGRVTAFNLFTGKKVGELKYDGEIEQAALINNISLIFIVNELKERFSTLVIYDFKNSREINSVKLNGKLNNELLLVNNKIYVVSDFGDLYKLSPSGMIIWKKVLNHQVHANPAADNNYIYMASLDGNLLKVDLDDGKIIYDKKISKGFQSGISIDGDDLFIGDIEGNIFSINKLSGDKNWLFKTSSKIVSTPTLDQNNIYVGNLNGDLYSISRKTSELNWVYKSSGLINSPCLVFKNLIIQPNLFMKMEILNKNNGALLNQINYDSRVRTAPIYYKDKLFIGVDKGEIYCYSFKENEK
jgi:outer membrane protein assembly factor BamB